MAIKQKNWKRKCQKYFTFSPTFIFSILCFWYIGVFRRIQVLNWRNKTWEKIQESSLKKKLRWNLKRKRKKTILTCGNQMVISFHQRIFRKVCMHCIKIELVKDFRRNNKFHCQPKPKIEWAKKKARSQYEWPF